MLTIDLEENEDVILVPDQPEEPKNFQKDLQFKRKLISQVRRNRILYDSRHKLFSNVAKKDLVWQQIASKVKSDVDVCKETWFELRYNYQRHARKLRNYFAQGPKNKCKRPVMALESELIFLWKVIDDRKTCEIDFEIPEEENTQTETKKKPSRKREKTNSNTNQKPIDDDLILVEPPVELIVIDEDDDMGKSVKQFKLNANMKNLIALIKSHPEIFDSKHKDFLNYSRKSFLWNAIASKLADKATKLMKCWIVMQTRYEWEISQSKKTADNAIESELQVELKFFKDFILENPSTVYKQSYFLKNTWYDPIDYFKDIYNLIVRMKKMSDIVYITDSLLKTPEKSKQYIMLWTDIANLKNSSPGQCETTWLIMRYFYWELMNMRQENYQLTDKWYFETIITELYAISKAAQARHELELIRLNKQNKKANKRSAQANAISLGAPANKRSSPILIPDSTSTTTQISPTIANNFQNIPPTNTTLTTQTAQPALILPKITAAISLAPQALNSGSLQIKQISGPPALSPAPFQLNNGTNGTAAPPAPSVSTNMTTMSFNLPNQTRVTPITMPALIRPIQNNSQPIARNTTSATISVRPPSQLKPHPQIQIASWATAPKTTVNSTNVVTQIHNYLQPAIRNSFGAPQMPPNLQPPSLQPLTRGPLPTMQNPNFAALPTMQNPNLAPPLPFNQQTSPLQPYNNQNTLVPSANPPRESIAAFKITSLPANTTISPCTPSLITPAISTSTPCTISPLTNNNNRTIFTMAASEPNTVSNSSRNDNNNTQFPRITGAISLLNPNEILIELIASHKGNQLVVHGPPLSAKYQLTMQTVAKFIREVLAIPMLHSKQNVQINLINFYWDHISKTFNLPVHICRAIWNFLLENFDHFPQIAPMKELMKPFLTSLNVWVESTELFKKFDDMCSTKDWVIHSKDFPDVVQCISEYPVTYQEKKSENEMEMLCAWRTISLRFPKNSNIQQIWTALKTFFVQYMNDLEIGIDNKWSANWWRSLARMKFLVEARYATNEPYYYIISNKMLEEIDRFATLEMKNRNNIEDAATDSADETSNIELEIRASVISSKDKNNVEMGTLLTAIQKYPVIFTKAGTIEKYEAWKNVADELGKEVPSCVFAFKYAAEKYLAYKKRDPVNRLHINERYYKKFDEIINSMPFSKLSSACRAKINIKTPFELNQSVDTENSADLIFPERFITDIKMSNSPSDLVVKNWVYAIGNIPNFNESSASSKLAAVLKKYLPDVTTLK